MLSIILYLIIAWAVIVIILRNDRNRSVIPVRVETESCITDTSIIRKDYSEILYRVLTSRPFFKFVATLFYQWLRSLTNVIYLLPRAIVYMAFVYCIYDPSVITRINLSAVQLVFEALSKNIESVISLILAVSVLELVYREGFYSLSSNSINEIGEYKSRLIRQHLNFPEDAKIVIQRSKRKKSEG